MPITDYLPDFGGVFGRPDDLRARVLDATGRGAPGVPPPPGPPPSAPPAAPSPGVLGRAYGAGRSVLGFGLRRALPYAVAGEAIGQALDSDSAANRMAAETAGQVRQDFQQGHYFGGTLRALGGAAQYPFYAMGGGVAAMADHLAPALHPTTPTGQLRSPAPGATGGAAKDKFGPPPAAPVAQPPGLGMEDYLRLTQGMSTRQSNNLMRLMPRPQHYSGRDIATLQFLQGAADRWGASDPDKYLDALRAVAVGNDLGATIAAQIRAAQAEGQ